jgi:hypothetical protein
MKVWTAAKQVKKVGDIINPKDLKIESYTERLVNMFRAIVSRDPQTPHGKFYYVAQRLQEKFSGLKEGASSSEAEIKPEHNHSSQVLTRPESSSNQTPLDLLSEVAMGSSAAPPGCSQQQPTMQPLQSQQAMPGWYENTAMGGPPQPHEMAGMPQGYIDPEFDLTNFDFNMGNHADLSALLMPDGMMFNYGYTQAQNGRFGPQNGQF